MSGFGARSYTKVADETGVLSADPHRMVLMLFDGAIESISQARLHMRARRIEAKGQALRRAVRIVDEGLKASVDPQVDRELAGQLISLYQYITMRLLQAHLRNDTNALGEAESLLKDIRAAWERIGKPAAVAGAQSASAGGGTAAGRSHSALLRAYA